MIRKYVTISMMLVAATALAQTQLSRSQSPDSSAAPSAVADGGVAGGCNENQICEPPEDCGNCPNDCGLICGDGFCDTACEDCENCPEDCGCDFCTQNCESGVCVDACDDGFCDTACEDCDSCPEDCGCDFCTEVCESGVCVTGCDDGFCDTNCEDCDTCPEDCGCTSCETCITGEGTPFCRSDCGDGTCDPGCGENCSICPQDCACALCTTCLGVSCITDCGNGICDPLCENCSTCQDDCSCPTCTVCDMSGLCVDACGDGTCDPECEDCLFCVLDCGCDLCETCTTGAAARSCVPNCGDGVCDPACNENCFSCLDCACQTCEACNPNSGSCESTCGDETCDAACNENCVTCLVDCPCNACESCVPVLQGGTCTSKCGDGTCDPACEDCSNCVVDCGCAATLCKLITCEPGNANSDFTGCLSVPDPVCGACCFENEDCLVLEPAGCRLSDGVFHGGGTSCTVDFCDRDDRLSTVKKGSILIFPKVELRWDGLGVLTQDTILTLVNDFTRDVHVKLYFVNGDAPTGAVYADDLQTILVERAHNGWNNVDCVIELTENESTYLVMSTGVGGCQRLTILDPGAPPGRPNLEPDGGRVLRGVVYAFAVDEEQNEISHNHLSGHADIINYGLRSAWEYQAYAFQARNPVAGTPTDGTPGELSLDGLEYDYAFNTLLFDFFAVGSTALTSGTVLVMLDTDLTLHPVSADLRQDSCGPITTKAHFDIWNANEDFRSGTARCITCWDQTLLSAYSEGNGLDNNFILADLATDKGKARIDGQASFECDNLFVPPNLDDAILQWLLLHDRETCERTVAVGEGKETDCCDYTINDSRSVALLGVAAKVLSFSGGAIGRTWAGMNLVGAGQESAQILFDIPAPPETASNGDGRRPSNNAGQRTSLGQSPGK